MRLTRVHVDSPLAAGRPLELPESAGAHLVRVLRLGPGAALSVFDGAGNEHDATIARVRGMRVDVDLGARRDNRSEAALAVTLLQGISRAERMDWTVQKATELGVVRIVPLKTDHAVVRIDAAAGEKKREHWRSIASSAAEQCGRAVVPHVESPTTLADYIAARRAGGDQAPGLLLDPDAPSGLRGLDAPPPTGLALLIGPEGGFSANEIRLASTHGFRPTRLGPRVLRTETAAVAALTALQVLYGDLAE